MTRSFKNTRICPSHLPDFAQSMSFVCKAIVIIIILKNENESFFFIYGKNNMKNLKRKNIEIYSQKK